MLLGEKTVYDVKYSIFKVGEAVMQIDPELHYIDDSAYYLVTFKASSTGLLKFFYSDLHICYESYISVVDSNPTYSEREIYHGKTVDIQHDKFGYSDSVKITTRQFRKKRVRNFMFSAEDKVVKDALSAYIWFRQKDIFYSKQNIFFYLNNRLNEVEISPSDEVLVKDDYLVKKFNLQFPGVADIANDDHYVLANSKNLPLKAQISSDVGRFFFVLQSD